MAKLPSRNGTTQKPIINTLLIDGNALFKRGYHGSHDAYNKEGDHIGGIYQFIVTTKKFLTEDVYHNIYTFWDGNFSGKLRYNIYSDYKSNRNKDYINGTEPDDKVEKIQQYIVKEYLHNLGIKQVEDEVVEADDNIAMYCKLKADNELITICTSDRDLCQLITDDVRVYLCDKREYVTLKNYQTIFNHHPDNLTLIKILAGDTSDMIKGVRGLNEKTIIKHFPSVVNEKVSIQDVINEAVNINNNRINDGKSPLKVISNIINAITDGIQGERLYEINESLIDLKNPKVTNESMKELTETIENKNIYSNIRKVYELIKRDGLDDLIKEYYISDYLLPFKKYIDRNKNKTIEFKNNEQPTY